MEASSPPPPGASCALETCTIRHSSPCAPSLHPQHRALPSHPIPSRTSNELEDPNSSLVAAVPPGRPQNPNQNLPSARCSPSGTGTRLLCIAVLPVRSRTAAPQCRSVLPRPRPRGATQNSMAVPAVLTFEAETGGCLSQVSARSPPAQTSRRNELFYWRRGVWQPGCASDWSMRGG